MKKLSKKEIYAQQGIAYVSGKIDAPLFGLIPPVLINGNGKLGVGVWTFSTLAGNRFYHVGSGSDCMDVAGTCPLSCPGCYAQTGRYNSDTVMQANARKTVLAKLYLSWLERAIIAQIDADHVRLLRIHASGDFFSAEYVDMWRRIALARPAVVMWTYTKYALAENAFYDVPNVNVVKSLIPGRGVNYGTCSYVMDAYDALRQAGESVYICRCGIDDAQHCVNCKGCTSHNYVLFVEHSTGYVAKSDPAYSALVDVIDAQASQQID